LRAAFYGTAEAVPLSKTRRGVIGVAKATPYQSAADMARMNAGPSGL